MKTKRLEEFILEEKQKGPFSSIWSDLTWSLKATPIVADMSQGYVSFRTGSGRGKLPFEQPFGDFARAVVSAYDRTHLEKPTANPYAMLQSALRALYDVLDMDRFDATAIDGALLTSAHDRYAADHGEVLSNRVGAKLEWMAALLDRSGVTTIGPWSFVRRKEKKAPLEDDLLDVSQLTALAEVSNADLAPSDRLLQCAAELMLIGGFRVGEVVTLPRDTWCEEPQLDDRGEPVLDDLGQPVIFCGLRYWAEKTGMGVAMIKPLLTQVAPRAKRLVAEALRLTHKAWTVARHQHLKGHTTLGPHWDDLPQDASMSDIDVAHALGLVLNLSKRAGKAWLSNNSVGNVVVRDYDGVGRSTKSMAKKADVYAALMRKSFHGNCRPDRKYATVRLDELLFIKDRKGVQGTARMVTPKDVRRYLGATRGSIFDRLGVTAVGKTVKISPKQFRCSLNVAVIRGGLSDMMVARFFGRTVVSLNDAYDRRSMEEKTEELLDRLELTRAFPKMDVPMLPAIPRSAPLVRSGRTAHLTTIGACYHSYAGKPCGAYETMVAAGFEAPGFDPAKDDGPALLEALEAQLAETSREVGAYGREAWILAHNAAISALRSRLGRVG